MKIVVKPIEVVSWTDINGNIRPLRFKIINEDESISVLKIERVCYIDKEKFAGNNLLVFNCQSIINGIEKQYELKYELSSCKWILFKI